METAPKVIHTAEADRPSASRILYGETSGKAMTCLDHESARDRGRTLRSPEHIRRVPRMSGSRFLVGAFLEHGRARTSKRRLSNTAQDQDGDVPRGGCRSDRDSAPVRRTADRSVSRPSGISSAAVDPARGPASVMRIPQTAITTGCAVIGKYSSGLVLTPTRRSSPSPNARDHQFDVPKDAAGRRPTNVQDPRTG